MTELDLSEFNYDLPPDRIAQYPVKERDRSRILISDCQSIKDDVFRNIGEYLPSGSLLVFNDTKVIQARILFSKESGAEIEILCLEPLNPIGYEQSFTSYGPVEWKCIIGNLKKWKKGPLTLSAGTGENRFTLTAEKVCPERDAWRIRFSWQDNRISFSEVLEAAGHVPLPPYINRKDTEDDRVRYQTVYSAVNGSVAAPTAGLHFTRSLLESLKDKGIQSARITLHVGAGTFRPVKSNNIREHEMHCEHFFVTVDTIEILLENREKIIAVGTTSVRTLESLYWIGVKMLDNSHRGNDHFHLSQWEAYDLDQYVSVKDSLEAVLKALKKSNKETLEASTSMLIIPGYKFRLIGGIITNFHQPGSTLLMLISAWTGKSWKKIYRYALDNNFRFLSYGDSSLLISERMK